MFGIGWSELLLTLGVALVVIGPKDLPQLLYSAGKLFKKFKRFTGDIQKSLDEILREEEIADIARTANKAGGDGVEDEVMRQWRAEQARLQAAQTPQPSGKGEG